jgi:hypothetical protein
VSSFRYTASGEVSRSQALYSVAVFPHGRHGASGVRDGPEANRGAGETPQG